ncbi:MAG: class I SAM-dependent methyltransferase [Thermoplasmata archaeon]
MHEAVWTEERARAVLDDPARREREDPRKLWRRAGLKAGMCVADVGAGSGFYSFPASDVVGRSGRVLAIDVSPELVAMVRARARRERRGNVVATLSRPGRIPLADALADRVLLANVVHGIPPATLREAARILRPGGLLIDLDWRKESAARGPPLAHRLSAAEARRALERYGLRAVGEWKPGPDHYALLLEKPVASEGVARRPRST